MVDADVDGVKVEGAPKSVPRGAIDVGQIFREAMVSVGDGRVVDVAHENDFLVVMSRHVVCHGVRLVSAFVGCVHNFLDDGAFPFDLVGVLRIHHDLFVVFSVLL